MAIKLPEKPFHAIHDLRKKWECTDDDIRHLIVTGEIQPSYFIRNLDGHMVSFKNDEFLMQMMEVDGYIFGAGLGPNISGYHFLREPFQEAPLECTFYLFSSHENTPKTDDSGGYWCRLDNGIGLTEVMDHGVIMNTEVARFESGNRLDQEKPLGNRERDSLLTIIQVLCKDAGYDHTKHSKTAAAIQSSAELMGLSISESTIESHIKKIQIRRQRA